MSIVNKEEVKMLDKWKWKFTTKTEGRTIKLRDDALTTIANLGIPEEMTPEQFVDCIVTRDDLYTCVLLLLRDWLQQPGNWNNLSLAHYLNAISAWLEHSQITKPSWKYIGKMLIAGKTETIKPDKNHEIIIHSLWKQIDTIKTRGDLANFVYALHSSLLQSDHIWENHTLDRYLEALSAWVHDMDGYYLNHGMPVPQQPTWRVVADTLYAASMYE